MRATMDRAGRLVIPAAARAALQIQAGQEFEIRVVDGWRLEMEPVGIPVRVAEENGLLVLEAEEPVVPVTDAQVREVIEADRGRRERRWE